MNMKELVAEYNRCVKIVGGKEVTRFATKSVAETRVKIIQAAVAELEGTDVEVPPVNDNAKGVFNYAPLSAPQREGNMQFGNQEELKYPQNRPTLRKTIFDLLRREGGATFPQCLEAVKGFKSRDGMTAKQIENATKSVIYDIWWDLGWGLKTENGFISAYS